MLINKKIALFACLFSFVPTQCAIKAMDMKKRISSNRLSKEELTAALNSFKPGNWYIKGYYSTGDNSSKVCCVRRDGDKINYVLKILTEGDKASYKREKLACDRFKPYLNGGKTFENICPPLHCGQIGDSRYYVIYEVATTNNLGEGMSDAVLVILWNDLLLQKIKAMKDLDSIGLLHVDPRCDNWVTVFFQVCQREGKKNVWQWKVKSKLIDFGSTEDISKLQPQDSIWATTKGSLSDANINDLDFNLDIFNAVMRNFENFLKSLKKNIQYLSGRRFSPEWNSDLGDEFDYKNKLIDNLISDLYKNNGGNMTLNQYQTLLDKLWSLLRISHSFDKEGNYVKNERVTAVYKNK